jgi:predicted RNase H-like nuclease (RuvC/YqgF family)
MSESPRNYTRQSDVAIQVISENVSQLKSDFHDLRSDLKEVVKEFSDSVSKLVVLEEKSVHTNINIERILKIAERSHERIDVLQKDNKMQIDQLESRIDQLEKDQPQIKLVINYVVKGVVAVVAIVGMAVLKLTVGI